MSVFGGKIKMSNDVLKAITIAERFHRGQKYGDMPYIIHPLRVLERVTQEVGGDYECLRVATVLHDIVEDTEFTLEDVELAFGKEVEEIVECLTRRKNETYEEYLGRIYSHPDDLPYIVKTADLRENLSNSPNSSLRNKYRNALKYLRTLSDEELDELEPLQ